MGQGYKARPEGMAAIAKRLDAMQKQIDALRNASGIQNGSIDNGGQLVVKDTNGKQVVNLGYDAFGDRGAAFTAPNGNDMLDFYVQSVTNLPFLRINDSTGTYVLITDADVAGTGLAWPWIPVVVQTQKIANWPSTNSGSFDTVASAVSNVFSQRLFVGGSVVCDGGATAGQARVLVNGSQIGSTMSVNTSVNIVDFGTPDFPGTAANQPVSIDIQCRVTAGSGNCRAQIFSCWWMQALD
jgi:hypothetical protein